MDQNRHQELEELRKIFNEERKLLEADEAELLAIQNKTAAKEKDCLRLDTEINRHLHEIMTLSVGHQNSVEQLVETFDGIDEKLKTLEKVKTLENSNDIPAMRKYLTGEGRTQYDILMRCTEVTDTMLEEMEKKKLELANGIQKSQAELDALIAHEQQVLNGEDSLKKRCMLLAIESQNKTQGIGEVKDEI